MDKLPYPNILFDLYGTLVDIRTDEDRPEAWAALARFYSYYGARYTPQALRAAYLAEVDRQTAGRQSLRRDSHEAHPEIELAGVFRALFRAGGIEADQTLAVHAGQFFRVLTTDYLRLYDRVPAMLAALRAKGAKLYLVSNAQAIFTACEMRAPSWWATTRSATPPGPKRPAWPLSMSAPTSPPMVRRPMPTSSCPRWISPG